MSTSHTPEQGKNSIIQQPTSSPELLSKELQGLVDQMVGNKKQLDDKIEAVKSDLALYENIAKAAAVSTTDSDFAKHAVLKGGAESKATFDGLSERSKIHHAQQEKIAKLQQELESLKDKLKLAELKEQGKIDTELFQSVINNRLDSLPTLRGKKQDIIGRIRLVELALIEKYASSGSTTLNAEYQKFQSNVMSELFKNEDDTATFLNVYQNIERWLVALNVTSNKGDGITSETPLADVLAVLQSYENKVNSNQEARKLLNSGVMPSLASEIIESDIRVYSNKSTEVLETATSRTEAGNEYAQFLQSPEFDRVFNSLRSSLSDATFNGLLGKMLESGNTAGLPNDPRFKDMIVSKYKLEGDIADKDALAYVGLTYMLYATTLVATLGAGEFFKAGGFIGGVFLAEFLGDIALFKTDVIESLDVKDIVLLLKAGEIEKRLKVNPKDESLKKQLEDVFSILAYERNMTLADNAKKPNEKNIYVTNARAIGAASGAVSLYSEYTQARDVLTSNIDRDEQHEMSKKVVGLIDQLDKRGIGVVVDKQLRNQLLQNQDVTFYTDKNTAALLANFRGLNEDGKKKLLESGVLQDYVAHLEHYGDRLKNIPASYATQMLAALKQSGVDTSQLVQEEDLMILDNGSDEEKASAAARVMKSLQGAATGHSRKEAYITDLESKATLPEIKDLYTFVSTLNVHDKEQMKVFQEKVLMAVDENGTLRTLDGNGIAEIFTFGLAKGSIQRMKALMREAAQVSSTEGARTVVAKAQLIRENWGNMKDLNAAETVDHALDNAKSIKKNFEKLSELQRIQGEEAEGFKLVSEVLRNGDISDKQKYALVSMTVMLDKAYRAFDTLNQEEKDMLMGDDYEGSARTSFSDYYRKTVAFVKAYNLKEIAGLENDAMQRTFEQMEKEFDGLTRQANEAHNNVLKRKQASREEVYRDKNLDTLNTLKRPPYAEAPAEIQSKQQAVKKALLEVNGILAGLQFGGAGNLEGIMGDARKATDFVMLNEGTFAPQRGITLSGDIDPMASFSVDSNNTVIQEHTPGEKDYYQISKTLDSILVNAQTFKKVAEYVKGQTKGKFTELAYRAMLQKEGIRLPAASGSTMTMSYTPVVRGDNIPEAFLTKLGLNKGNAKEVAGYLTSLGLYTGDRNERQKSLRRQETIPNASMSEIVIHALEHAHELRTKIGGRKTLSEAEQQVITFSTLDREDIAQVMMHLEKVDIGKDPMYFLNLGLPTKKGDYPYFSRRLGQSIVAQDTFKGEVIKNIKGVRIKLDVYLRERCLNVQIPKVELAKFAGDVLNRLELPGTTQEEVVEFMELIAPSIKTGLLDWSDDSKEKLGMIIGRGGFVIPKWIWPTIGLLVPPYYPGETPGTTPTPEGSPKRPDVTPNTEITTERPRGGTPTGSAKRVDITNNPDNVEF